MAFLPYRATQGQASGVHGKFQSLRSVRHAEPARPVPEPCRHPEEAVEIRADLRRSHKAAKSAQGIVPGGAGLYFGGVAGGLPFGAFPGVGALLDPAVSSDREDRDGAWLDRIFDADRQKSGAGR